MRVKKEFEDFEVYGKDEADEGWIIFWAVVGLGIIGFWFRLQQFI